MNRRGLSDVILAKVRDSAVHYAHKAAKRKPSFANAIKRTSEITGIKCSDEYTICHEHLDEILQQLELYLRSEQKRPEKILHAMTFIVIPSYTA